MSQLRLLFVEDIASFFTTIVLRNSKNKLIRTDIHFEGLQEPAYSDELKALPTIKNAALSVHQRDMIDSNLTYKSMNIDSEILPLT